MLGQGGSSLLYKARGAIKPPAYPRQTNESQGGYCPSVAEPIGAPEALMGPPAVPAGLGPHIASGPVLPKQGEDFFGPFGSSSSAARTSLNDWLGGLVLPAGLSTEVARVDDLCASVGASLSYQADDVALGSYYFRTILAKWEGEITGMASCTAALVTRAVAALSVNLAAKLLGNRFYSVSGLMQAVYGRQLQPGYALRLELSCLDALEWRVAPGCLLQKHEWDSAEATNAEYQTRASPQGQPLRFSPPGPTTPSQAAATTSAPRGRPGSLSRIVSSTALECLEQNPWHDEADMGMSDNATGQGLQPSQAQAYGAQPGQPGFSSQARSGSWSAGPVNAQVPGQAGFVPFRGPGYGRAATEPYSVGPGQAFGGGSGGWVGGAYAEPYPATTGPVRVCPTRAYSDGIDIVDQAAGPTLGGAAAAGAAGVAGLAGQARAPSGWGFRAAEASRWEGPFGGL